MYLVRVWEIKMCFLTRLCGRSFKKSSSWHEKWIRMRTDCFSIPFLASWCFFPNSIPVNVWSWKQFQLCTSGHLTVSHHVLDLCLADSQSQCIINLLLSPGLPHNHKWNQWNTEHAGISMADRPGRMKNCSRDKAALCDKWKVWPWAICNGNRWRPADCFNICPFNHGLCEVYSQTICFF